MNAIEKFLHDALEAYGERLSNDGCNDQVVKLTDETKPFLLEMAAQQADAEYVEHMREQIDAGKTQVYTENTMVVGYLAHLVKTGKIKVNNG